MEKLTSSVGCFLERTCAIGLSLIETVQRYVVSLLGGFLQLPFQSNGRALKDVSALPSLLSNETSVDFLNPHVPVSDSKHRYRYRKLKSAKPDLVTG